MIFPRDKKIDKKRPEKGFLEPFTLNIFNEFHEAPDSKNKGRDRDSDSKNLHHYILKIANF